MKVNKLTNVYLISFIVIFLLNLFVLNISSKLGLLYFFIFFLITGLFTFGYRKEQYAEKRILTVTMIMFALVHIAIAYAFGIFDGFSKNLMLITWTKLFKIVIPYLLIVLFIEIIRYVLVNKIDSKIENILLVILYVIIDVMLLSFNPNLKELKSFLEFFGLVLFPSIVSNIIYNIIEKEYGYKPIVAYRWIIVLSYYLFRYIPNIYPLFRSVGLIVLPLIIYLTIIYMFERIQFEKIYKRKKKFNIISIIAIVICLIFAALISCRFHYGIIAVGSGSMTGTIAKGDAVFLEKGKEIQEQDIIVFKRDDSIIVHRVVSIIHFDEQRKAYVTKGDNNKENDSGYVYDEDIIGVVHFKIRWIGIPAVFLKEHF